MTTVELERAYRKTTRGSFFPHVRFSLPLCLIFCSLILQTLAVPDCLRFADFNTINQKFTDGGPGTKVFLCPGKVYRLTGTIAFTSADQELATYGYPSGSQRATITVNGDFSTAIQGDCRRCARVSVSNLIIDGYRKKLGRIVDPALSTGLVVIGGNEGQTVKSCLLKDPRGFTAVHVREGDKLQCKGAVIEKNEIGPVGEEYDPKLDGPDPEMSPLGRPLADGVSIACRDSYVRDNLFYDNTDAAIVIYGSPGTLVHANTITSRTMSSMAGILLVDTTPFNGDYTGTVVKSNMIEAASRIIRVGIGLGPSVWSDDTETILRGGKVTGNGIRGRHMGYGIAAAGLDGWTIRDNWDEAIHDGRPSDRCFEDYVNPDPTAFLYNSKIIKNSDIQPDFVDHAFEYIVCIDGVEDPDAYYKDVAARRKAKEEKAEEKKTAEDPTTPSAEAPEEDKVETISTGSEVMDDILSHAQTRMLEAIEVLSRRVNVLADSARDKSISKGHVDGGPSSVPPQIANALNDLQSRIGDMEARQQVMIDAALTMRSALKSWNNEMSGMTEWQFDVLLDVQHRLGLYNEQASNSDIQQRDTEDQASSSDGNHNSISDIAIGGSSWSQPIRFIIAQAVFILVVMYGRKWWSSKSHRKVL